VLLCHGTPGNDAEYLLESVDESGLRAASAAEIERRLGEVSATMVACGHTHIPRTVRTRHGHLIVNPGSVGLQAYDDARPLPHAVETGSPDARYAILERRHGAWTVALMTVPYDHHAMAALAARNGRPDWEIALQTGYVRR
jgi:predicted phosphodiesterase